MSVRSAWLHRGESKFKATQGTPSLVYIENLLSALSLCTFYWFSVSVFANTGWQLVGSLRRLCNILPSSLDPLHWFSFNNPCAILWRSGLISFDLFQSLLCCQFGHLWPILFKCFCELLAPTFIDWLAFLIAFSISSLVAYYVPFTDSPSMSASIRYVINLQNIFLCLYSWLRHLLKDPRVLFQC